MKRSKLKKALRPIVKEALSDYLKDTEQDMRALQTAHPQLDLQNTPAERGVKKDVAEDIAGDVKWVDKAGARVKKVNGKTVIFPTNPKNTQKIADALNDSGEYEVEVLKGGGILVKYQSPLTKVEGKVNEAPFTKKQLWMQKFEKEMYKLSVPKGGIGKEWWQNGEYLFSKGVSPEEAARKTVKIQEASTTAAVPGYQTPYAFSDTSIGKDAKKRKIAQQLGYKLVEKNRLKEEVGVKVTKAVPFLNEEFKPRLITPIANQLYMKMLDYLLMSSDPQYRTIHKFRVAIDKVPNQSDKKQLILAFNDEFRVGNGSSQSAWDYYKDVD